MKDSAERKVTAPSLLQMKQEGARITMLTAYDANTAQLLDQAGVDVLLVGDSVGMVFQGQSNTLAVTIDHIIYHARAVVRGCRRAHVVGDMPFMSYQASLEEGVRNAGRILKESGAEAVKLEGGSSQVALVQRLSSVGIPVMGHIGLTPQSVHAMGGYKVQGRRRDQVKQLIEDALALQAAGAYSLVLEGIPREVASQITTCLDIPTIGIGAGPNCDGQVLVINDLLGMNQDFAPKFVKRYENLAERITVAVKHYVTEVRAGVFPAEEHCFKGEKKASGRKLQPSATGDDQPDASTTQVDAAEPGELAETIPLYPGVRRRK
jgi:3-methyl-2-oxobutanoate hydroxymethyltransferase